MMIVFGSSDGGDQHASSRQGPLSWAVVLAVVASFRFLFLCSNIMLAASVGAESVQHISTNLFGDLFGVAGLKQDGHEVSRLLMAHVDFSFEQEA